jgi:hypothetical protein
MKKVIFFLLFNFFSIFAFSQSLDTLTIKQQQQLSILTEDCIKLRQTYNGYPMYVDVAQRTVFYVKLEKGNVRTFDVTIASK